MTLYKVRVSAAIAKLRPRDQGTRMRAGIAFGKEPILVSDPPRVILSDPQLQCTEVAVDVPRSEVRHVERRFYSLGELGFRAGILAKASGDALALAAQRLGIFADPGAEDPELLMREQMLELALVEDVHTVRLSGALLVLELEHLDAHLDDVGAILGVDWGKKTSKASKRELVLEVLAEETDLETLKVVAEQLQELIEEAPAGDA